MCDDIMVKWQSKHRGGAPVLPDRRVQEGRLLGGADL